ncbi:MotE family protein [Blastochloris sulfoviridis]|uniref:Flagellar protein FlbB n=1 Tax=Blastochloris sulfoviridis TaxID=50712 RepID=A0A5M6I3J7_9HYPH|nr:flagellar protein FlbB [Blastochloris sulfoviridis]KAA5602753.1 flagellar protein FlbB [Blastochloris sulfoviridis]
MREFRLIPIVLVAASSLLVLKTLWLVTGGSPDRGPETVVAAPAPAAQQMEPDVSATGSAAKSEKPKEPPKPDAKEPPGPMPGPVTQVPTEPDQGTLPAGEKALLQRLQERRQELEARERELDMREGMLKAAETRLEGRLQELKATEARIATATAEKDEAEKERFKGLVVMYEAMRAKDAARIFDRLDVKLAVEVVNLMNPRKFSEVMAQMSPESAERLTVELANRKTVTPTSDLPKIEGRKL